MFGSVMYVTMSGYPETVKSLYVVQNVRVPIGIGLKNVKFRVFKYIKGRSTFRSLCSSITNVQTVIMWEIKQQHNHLTYLTLNVQYAAITH